MPERLRTQAPDATAAFENLGRAAREIGDPVLLELIRLRIAMLVGHPTERSPWVTSEQLSDDKIANLSRWPSSPLFDERDRDCLAFAEQFVIDVAGLTDEQASLVRRHFDPNGFYAFAVAVYSFDFQLRLEMVAAALLPEEVP